MAIYDFNKINNEVPIEAVLEMHGIYPNSKGKYSIRPEDDTPSASINKEKIGNAIHDFGAGVEVAGRYVNTLNPITLTMYLQNKGAVEAAQILGERFGIEPKGGAKDKSSDYVSDREWAELLIYPVARNNMMFFPDKFGHERTRLYAEKHQIPMSELKKENIKTYENIVFSKGFARVEELKNIYYWGLYSWHNLCKELNVEIQPEKLKTDEEITQSLKALVTAERVLKKALIGTSKKFTTGYYDVVTDMYKVVNGQIPFEIGKVSSREIEKSANANNATVFCCKPISKEYYLKLLDNGLDNIEFSAKQKGDSVVVSFKSTDSSKVNYLVQALRGKERNLAEVLSQSALEFEEGLQEDTVIDKKAEISNEKLTADKPDNFEYNKETTIGIS